MGAELGLCAAAAAAAIAAGLLGRRAARSERARLRAEALLREAEGAARDVDAARTELRAATKVNALVALVAQHMPNAVLIADAGGSLLWANVVFEKLSGVPAAELPNQALPGLLNRVMNGFAVEDAVLMVEAGQPAAIVTKNTSPDGKVRWFSVTLQPVRNEAQDVVNFIVLIDDFTAFREAHLRQRHSEEIAIQVSRMAHVGAWELLLPSQELTWEPELYRICQVELGYRPTLDKMAGFLPEEGREALLGRVRTAIAEGLAFDMESPLQTALGQQRWVQIYGWPETADARVVRVFGTVQDITERHAAESERGNLQEQLFQLQKMETLGSLAGGIAHDFNNLLTGMIGNQDLALEDIGAGHPARPRIEEARKATLLACELVEQILTFSRQTGEERVPTDLAVVAEEARRFLRASVPASVRIEINAEPHCGRVLADPAQLNQLLLNLGSNSAHAMRASGGVLTISIAPAVMTATQAAAKGNLPPGPYVRLSVRDTGHGMDAETQRRIFNPFFTTKSAGEGTGLGLPIVQSIVRAHGGGVEVTSAPGQGTTVDVYLPLAEGGFAAETVEAEQPPPKGSGEVICIVDDEQVVAQTTRITLERLGYRTLIFYSARECLAALGKDAAACSLLLTDQTMPEMNGVELAGRVRSLAPRLPIVIMSGYFSKILPDTLEQIGRISLLAKPFRSAEMARILAEALHPPGQSLSPPTPG
jgi:PAS domain S-box-containing protein